MASKKKTNHFEVNQGYLAILIIALTIMVFFLASGYKFESPTF